MQQSNETSKHVRKQEEERTKEHVGACEKDSGELIEGNSGDQKIRRRGAIYARDKYAPPRATNGTEQRQRHHRRQEDRGGRDQPNKANGGVKRLTAGRRHTYKGP